jgi:predicted enzyme related to lactoylglutathione lyase
MASEMTIRFELFVSDRDRSVDFYTSVLGFEVQRLDEAHALLTCGQVTLGLGRQADLPETGDGPGFTQQRLERDHGAGVEIVLETPDLDVLYERVRRSGYPLAAPMQDRPWGLRDFRVTDPDGYYLRITAPTATGPSEVPVADPGDVFGQA